MIEDSFETGLTIDDILGDKAKYIEAINELLQNAHSILEIKTNESLLFQDQIENLKETVQTVTGTVTISTALVIALFKEIFKNKS